MDTNTLSSELDQSGTTRQRVEATALVLAWSSSEPSRMGEAVLPSESGEGIFGRGGPRGSDNAPRLPLVRLGPHASPRPPLRCPKTSRQQLRIVSEGSMLRLTRVGRAPMAVNGEAVDEAVVGAGDVVEVGAHLVWYVDRVVVGGASIVEPHPFGEPDSFGIVGESAATWTLRAAIEFAGCREPHVLVKGQSGTGKELVAQALHAVSSRGTGPFVSRNAATIPEGVIDAELFGHAKDYPNSGMPEREGLVAAAHRGTLFLDEFAELPLEQQAHLLRVLDAGEFQRLGETHCRRSNLRLIAATNRPDDALRADLMARFPIVINVPPLAERRADIPLIARHIVGRIAGQEPDLASRFMGPDGPRFTATFMRAALRHEYTTNVRELEALIWKAFAQSPGDALHLSVAQPAGPPSWQNWVGRPPGEIPPEQLVACLRDHANNQVRTAEALGLSSRHVLGRLLRKHQLT